MNSIMQWRSLPRRCLLATLCLALGLGVAWAGWQHWRAADARLAQQTAQVTQARTALAALEQRQQQRERDAPLWRELRQRGWLAPENRLQALDILSRLPRQPGVQRASAQLGPRQALAWPWLASAPLARSTLHVRMRLAHPRHLSDVLAPLAELPGLMLPTACQWRQLDSEDDSVDGECELAWVTELPQAR